MQQQMMGAPPMGAPPMAQPAAQPAAPAPAEAPAQVMMTSIVLVTPASKDGDLVRAEGQRTSVPIKVELDGAREPTGSYATATSLREKAGSSFPLDGSGWSWKLYVGEMLDNQPANVAIVAGDNDAASNSSWRELFSCKVIDGAKPVVFAQPCLAGHEGRDVDRKRKASMELSVEKAEVEAAVQQLSSARPAKHGMGQDGASLRSGKQVVQLDGDAKVARLCNQLKMAVDKSKTSAYLHPRDHKPIFILTDGVWVKPVFTADRSKLLTPGFYREISVDAIDASFLNDDETLKRGALFFACRCCPPSVPPKKAASLTSKAVVSTTPTWQKNEVTVEASAGGHKSATKAGGIILRSFQSTVKYHHDKYHGGGSVSTQETQQKQALFFQIGSALLQQPAAQQALQEAAAVQSKVEQPQTLTPADPPEPPPIVLRYPFDAPLNAKERDVANIRLADITTKKLGQGSQVSEHVFDLLRRYELQCALSAGVSSKHVLIMAPYDFFLIERRMKGFEIKNDLVIDLTSNLLTDRGLSFAAFQLLNSLQTKVGLSSFCSRTVPYTPPPQFVSVPLLSSSHNSELIWLPKFNIAFAFDSYPELHKQQVRVAHTFLQHVACSTIEVVYKTAETGIPHQPTEGTDVNVCAFSASLFLQLGLSLLKEHGPTPLLVENLRGLTVEESQYHKYRKRAAKEINSLVREYGRRQQEARIQQRKRANAGEPSSSNE